ncbi:MAG: TauD/TfdA family dioxygenase [Actinomycetota bacterium]
MSIEITQLGGAIGALVSGIDLRSLDDQTFQELHTAWLLHLVLIFPDQHLSPTEQRDFASWFGELEIHPLTEKLDDTPEVTLLHSERGGRADVWHTDVTFNDTPPIAAVLQQISGPVAGGDTMWANQYAAFESMSSSMQTFVRGLTAIHTAWPQGHPEMKAERPLVLRHPATGREALAVNRLFTTRIPQLEQTESDAVLALLFAWGERPELTCRWKWSAGDVAIWDNRCTRHYAVGDYKDDRVMHRVTVLGTYVDPTQESPATPHQIPTRLSAASAFERR